MVEIRSYKQLQDLVTNNNLQNAILNEYKMMELENNNKLQKGKEMQGKDLQKQGAVKENNSVVPGKTVK